MRDEIKVETCEVVWNMARQCHEITIVGERDGFQTRIFLTDLGENYETRLQRAEMKCERLEKQLETALKTLAKQEGVELENAIASQADFYQQQISVLEDRVKELEIQIGAYESCLALMPEE